MPVTCECGKEHADWMPKTRFDEVYRERKTLKGQVSTLEGALEESQKASQGAEALRTTIEQQAEEIKAANARYETHTTISGHGITDPDTVRAIEFFAPKDAPLADTLAAWREKPETAPSVLRSVFTPANGKPPAPGTPPAPGAPPAPAPGTPPAPFPNLSVGAQPTPPAAPGTTDFSKVPDAQLQADMQNPNSEFYKLFNGIA